jgi:D-alanyl-D-alanine carboxypeptidase (penicillin-binding protein 5/6)
MKKKRETSAARTKRPVHFPRWLIPVLCVLLAGAIFLGWRLSRTPTLELPYLSAQYVAVMDGEDGKLLYDKDADKAHSPASLTKLMTLFLVLDDIDSGALDWEDTYTVTPAEAHTQGSKYGMHAGEVFTVRQLVAGTIMASGCDCVQCLVQMTTGDEETFVVRMNEKAKELGLNGSHFVNATGIDADQHYMTARDLAVLARTLVQTHPEILDFSSQRSLTLGEYTFSNLNRLAGRDERVVGLKTGTTLVGGYNLVTCAQQDGKQYFIVLLNSSSDDTRFSETETILDALFGEVG